MQFCFALSWLDEFYLEKNFRALSIEFVRVMDSMQEIFNLMLARLVCLDNLVAMNAKTNFTSLADVFQAVDSGTQVFWESLAYKVIKHTDGDYYTLHPNRSMSYIGKDYKAESFFINPHHQ